MLARRGGRAGTITLALLAVVPATAAATTSADALSALNAQRAFHGLPGPVTENPRWSLDCAAHNAYQRENGGELTHDEDPAKPGYTPGGADAARNGVLAFGLDWAEGNPFEDGPFHLHQILAPRLSTMGLAQDGPEPLVCATTLKGLDRPRPATVATFTYPGPGTSGFRLSQTADELPYAPGELVGIPKGATTGPYLLVSFDGPWRDARARLATAQLLGPGGPVDVRTVDNHTPDVGTKMPTGGEVIPVEPLQEGTHHLTVRATIRSDRKRWVVEHAFAFTTGGERVPAGPAPSTTVKSVGPAAPTSGGSSTAVAPAGAVVPSRSRTLRLGRPHRTPSGATLVLDAGSALVGRSATVSFVPAGGGRALVRRVRLQATQRLRFRASRGVVRVSVSSFTAGSTTYGPSRAVFRLR